MSEPRQPEDVQPAQKSLVSPRNVGFALIFVGAISGWLIRSDYAHSSRDGSGAVIPIGICLSLIGLGIAMVRTKKFFSSRHVVVIVLLLALIAGGFLLFVLWLRLVCATGQGCV